MRLAFLVSLNDRYPFARCPLVAVYVCVGNVAGPRKVMDVGRLSRTVCYETAGAPGQANCVGIQISKGRANNYRFDDFIAPIYCALESV